MMDRIGRPRGLIAYDTDTAVAARAIGDTPLPFKLLRMRTLLYATLIAAIGGLMMFGLATKATFEVNVLKDRSPAFVQLSSGDIRNGYALKLVNKSTEARQMTVRLSGVEDASFKIIGIDANGAREFVLPVAAYGVDRYRVLVTAPSGAVRRTIEFTVIDQSTGETESNRVSLNGPKP